jgi:hypothetical protein
MMRDPSSYIDLYDQAVLTDAEKGTHGDCVRACIRTLTQRPMSSLPHPIAADGGWNSEFFKVLREKYHFLYKTNPYYPEKEWDFLPPIIMARGSTERTEEINASHLVVWNRETMTMVHDPHPSRSGLLEISAFHWLEKIE